VVVAEEVDMEEGVVVAEEVDMEEGVVVAEEMGTEGLGVVAVVGVCLEPGAEGEGSLDRASSAAKRVSARSAHHYLRSQMSPLECLFRMCAPCRACGNACRAIDTLR